MNCSEKLRIRFNGSSRRSQLKLVSATSGLNDGYTNVLASIYAKQDNQIKSPRAIKLGQIVMLTLILASIQIPLKIHCQTSILPEKLSAGLEESTVDSKSELSSDWLSEDPANILNNTVSKLKPVNFSLVNEIFETVLDNDEVVKRWKNMDLQLQDGIKSILKMVFPLIVTISQDAKVSGDCSGGILKWILSLRNLRSWAIKMLDATGKPSSGIFEGSLTMFGNYRQCLSIRAPDEDEMEITEQFEEYFRGQYCVLHLKPWMPVKDPYYHFNSSIEPLLRKNYKYYEKTLYDDLAELAIAFNFMDIRMDLCVPSTCTVADIQRVAELLSRKLEMRAKVMRCDIASRDTNRFQYLDLVSCYWLALPACLALTSILSAIIAPLVSRGKSRGCKRFTNILKCLSFAEALKGRFESPNKTTSIISDGMAVQDQTWASSSSLTTNYSKPLALYGLRSLFVFWFIIVQMTVELKYQYLRESITLRNMLISYWPFQIIVNSVLLFDSIILITAFTYSYTCLESTLKDLIIYIAKKYIRLILPIMTLIAITMLTPILAIESPVWRNFVEDQSAVCKSNGHLNLIFFQNFISYEKICLPHTWLFCVELQLVVLSIPLVILFKKGFLETEDSMIIKLNSIEEEEKKRNRKICLFRFSFINLIKTKAGLFSVLFFIAGLFINFFNVYNNQLPPSWFYTFPDEAQKNYYFGTYITKTWTHLSVFLIGLLAGHLCRATSQLGLLKQRQPSITKDLQLSQQQPSPTATDLANDQSSQLTLRHNSTSTIMTAETSNQHIDDSSTSENLSNNSRLKNKQLDWIRFVDGTVQIVALVCMSAIIFSTYSWSTKQSPPTLIAAIYDLSSRLVWSLALALLTIQLCLPNKEANKYLSANNILSHPICISVGRLSFLAYLLAPYVNTFILAVQEQSLFPSLFILFHVIVGNIVITYILAFILAIVIEQPLKSLFTYLVLGRRFCRRRGSMSIFAPSHNK